MLYLYFKTVSIYIFQNQEKYAYKEEEKEKIFIYSTIRGSHKWKKKPQVIHTKKELCEMYAVIFKLNLQ